MGAKLTVERCCPGVANFVKKSPTRREQDSISALQMIMPPSPFPPEGEGVK